MIRPRVHVLRIEEVFRPGNPGFWVHPDWESRFPWLVQGTTGRGKGEGEALWDFALFAVRPTPPAPELWEALGEQLSFPQIAHSHQVHGREVSVHRGGSPMRGRTGVGFVPGGEPRLKLGPDADGHVTGEGGILLGVTVADCVPVFLVDPSMQAVGLLHAGWRGVVSGILERGIELLREEFLSLPEDIHLHLGPAICRECYEVGGEVHLALGLPEPDGPSPVDLRGHLTSRAVAAGVREARVTESAWCTLCGGSPFFSHRRGNPERQVGFLGIVP